MLLCDPRPIYCVGDGHRASGRMLVANVVFVREHTHPMHVHQQPGPRVKYSMERRIKLRNLCPRPTTRAKPYPPTQHADGLHFALDRSDRANRKRPSQAYGIPATLRFSFRLSAFTSSLTNTTGCWVSRGFTFSRSCMTHYDHICQASYSIHFGGKFYCSDRRGSR